MAKGVSGKSTKVWIYIVSLISLYFSHLEKREIRLYFSRILENSQEYKETLQILYFLNNIDNIYLNFYSCLTYKESVLGVRLRSF